MIRGVGGRAPGWSLPCASHRGRSAAVPKRQGRITSSAEYLISQWIRSGRAEPAEGNASHPHRTCRLLVSGCWGRLRTTSGPGSGGGQNADVGPQPHSVRGIRRSTFARRRGGPPGTCPVYPEMPQPPQPRSVAFSQLQQSLTVNCGHPQDRTASDLSLRWGTVRQSPLPAASDVSSPPERLPNRGRV